MSLCICGMGPITGCGTCDAPELRIAVDPASPKGDYTAKCEYRILADGRVRIERIWIEPRTDVPSDCHGQEKP